MNRILMVLFAVLAAGQGEAFADKRLSESPQGARAYIICPEDGQTVDGTFTVRFGLANMGVAPAGVKMDNTGHHHLLIDFDGLPDMEKPLAFGENIRHFGGGQTEAEITLPPGKHTLQLLLGNYLHIPHNPPVLSKKITVTVKGK